MLANDYNAWIVADDADVERVWIYRRTRHAGRVRVGAALGQVRQFFALRGERFDVAIAAGGKESPRAIHRALTVHAGRTISYAADTRAYGPRLTDALPPPARGHEIDRMMGLLAPLGVAAPPVAPLPRFRVPQRWIDDARRWLAEAGIAADGYVILGLSARDPQKVPSTEQVLRWSARWRDEHGCATLLQFTPGDASNALYHGSDAPARAILAAAPAYVHAMPDGLPAAIGSIHLARTSVLPDSGLMHFAAASPGGVAGLFADCPRLASPEQWGPRGPRAMVIEAPKAIAELDDDQVFASLRPLLSRGGRIGNSIA